ncbi:unnamed protein product [Ascophyllum nodosum]
MRKLCVVIGVTRRDILPLLKGEEKPTDTAKIADCNRANEDLYAMLYLLVELPAALLVQKYEDESEISGDGQAAFKDLCGNYDKVTDEVIRATMQKLVNRLWSLDKTQTTTSTRSVFSASGSRRWEKRYPISGSRTSASWASPTSTRM